MKSANELSDSDQWLSTLSLRRAVWITLSILVVAVLAFAGYYISDRYVHPGDQSTLEHDIETMELAIRHDPDNPESYLLLAETYLIAGEYSRALGLAEQVRDLYPENMDARLIAGISLLRIGRTDAALDPLQSFVASRKDRPMAGVDSSLEAAYYYLGECFVTLGQPAAAVSALEAALAIDPVDADALYQMALAYQSAGQPEAAIGYLLSAVRLVPDFAEAYSAMIGSYTAMDEVDYQRYARGMLAYCLGDYPVALTQLRAAAASLKDFAPAHLGLGLTYERTGQPDLAQQALRRAIQLQPDDIAALQALGRIEEAQQSDD